MTTTRRDLLTGSVALVASPLMPIGATPAAAAARASDGTFHSLLAAHDAAAAELNGEEPPDLTYEESEALFDSLGDKLTDVQERIAAEPATTPFGVLVKWHVIRPSIEDYFCEGGTFDRIAKSIDRDLERLAAGGAA